MGPKPQYLFLYKYKELLDTRQDKILIEDFEGIEGNIVRDVISLYNISCSYCGQEETTRICDEVVNISESMEELYQNDFEQYKALTNNCLSYISVGTAENEKQMK